MNALELLLTRQSQIRLQEPAPSGIILDNIKKSAMRVPDHCNLKVGKFIVFQGEQLKELGDIFQKAAYIENMSERTAKRANIMPLRAPMIILGIAKTVEHPKVPQIEQINSVACSMHAMQMAAIAQDFQGIWLTGDFSQSQTVKNELGLSEQDEIVGFLYLGSKVFDTKTKPEVPYDNNFQDWNDFKNNL